MCVCIRLWTLQKSNCHILGSVTTLYCLLQEGFAERKIAVVLPALNQTENCRYAPLCKQTHQEFNPQHAPQLIPK